MILAEFQLPTGYAGVTAQRLAGQLSHVSPKIEGALQRASPFQAEWKRLGASPTVRFSVRRVPESHLERVYCVQDQMEMFTLHNEWNALKLVQQTTQDQRVSKTERHCPQRK